MLLYPGLCLLEATNISEGRGSDLSFMAAGAPWLNASAVAEMMTHTLKPLQARFAVQLVPALRAFAPAP